MDCGYQVNSSSTGYCNCIISHKTILSSSNSLNCIIAQIHWQMENFLFLLVTILCVKITNLTRNSDIAYIDFSLRNPHVPTVLFLTPYDSARRMPFWCSEFHYLHDRAFYNTNQNTNKQTKNRIRAMCNK